MDTVQHNILKSDRKYKDKDTKNWYHAVRHRKRISFLLLILDTGFILSLEEFVEVACPTGSSSQLSKVVRSQSEVYILQYCMDL